MLNSAIRGNRGPQPDVGSYVDAPAETPITSRIEGALNQLLETLVEVRGTAQLIETKLVGGPPIENASTPSTPQPVRPLLEDMLVAVHNLACIAHQTRVSLNHLASSIAA